MSPRAGFPQCSDNQENKKKSGEAKQNAVSNFLLICSGPLYCVTVFSTAIYIKAFILLWCKKRKFLLTFRKHSLKKHIQQFRSGETFWLFLSVAKTTVGLLVCCCYTYLDIQFSVFSIFSILHLVITPIRKTKKLPSFCIFIFFHPSNSLLNNYVMNSFEFNYWLRYDENRQWLGDVELDYMTWSQLNTHKVLLLLLTTRLWGKKRGHFLVAFLSQGNMPNLTNNGVTVSTASFNFFGFLRDLLRYFTINISFSPSLRKPNELFTSIAKLRRDDS